MTHRGTEIQREYYANTAVQYDAMHLETDKEHEFALAILYGLIDYLAIDSVLDIGSGTGRVIQYLKNRRSGIHIIGIEPVAELRDIGHQKGIDAKSLIDGDVEKLDFDNDSFDLVCEFAVLHHVPTPQVAVAEMLRVAKKAIYISDTNRFGQGNWLNRKLKQTLKSLGLWNTANWIKTGGKKYIFSEGDGVAYSYSVFDNYYQIKQACRSVHIFNTVGAGVNLYDSAPNVALLGIKK